jgi:hypothetical protein
MGLWPNDMDACLPCNIVVAIHMLMSALYLQISVKVIISCGAVAYQVVVEYIYF